MTESASHDWNSEKMTSKVHDLLHHRVYAKVNSESSLKRFMQSHVFCVWDFQSLLKGLQKNLTCVEVPWLPSSDPDARRLINEIVLDEESDDIPGIGYLSHFELYMNAMKQCGADTGPILKLIDSLKKGAPIDSALSTASLPPGVEQFVGNTLRIAKCNEIHRIAAAFTYGREDIIPAMFGELVQALSAKNEGRWELFLLYLNRHIETDGERHGPLSRALVKRLCGEDKRLWSEAEETVYQCIDARIALWDSIADAI